MNQLPDAPAPNQLRRIAVIGGGITGLTAANRLLESADASGSPIELTLFEASHSVGGVAGTLRIGDYMVETGADNFITNKPAAVRLCERLGIADWLIPTETQYRGSLVLRNGSPEPVPDGFMLLSPAKIRPVLRSRIFSPLGKLRMGLELLVPRGNPDGDESLADFVRRRFGREALERLVQPLVGGIYTSDPEKLSLRATMSRFLDMEREHRSLILASRREAAGDPETEPQGAGARYGLFAAFTEGTGSLFQFLLDRIRKRARVCLGTPVDGLSREADGRIALRTSAGVESFDGVIVAVPAFTAADLIAGLAADEQNASTSSVRELCSELKAIEYASTAIVCSGHRLSDCRHPLDSFGLVIPAIEQRRVLAASFSSRKFPGRAPDDRVLIRTFVGGAMQPEMLEHSDSELLQLVADELKEMLGVEGTPDFAEVFRHNRSMPQYYVGHMERVGRISKLASELSGIELAGNAYEGVGLPDCIQSAENAVQRLLSQQQDPIEPST